MSNTATFYSTLQGEDEKGLSLRNYSGQTVEIVRPLTEAEADQDECGPMYLVRAADGVEFHVFDEEINGNVLLGGVWYGP